MSAVAMRNPRDALAVRRHPASRFLHGTCEHHRRIHGKPGVASVRNEPAARAIDVVRNMIRILFLGDVRSLPVRLRT
jgi:hypothetical protein